MHTMKNQQTPACTTGAETTVAQIAPGDCRAALPEFGRIPDVQRLFGLKCGFTYQLINVGKIRSVNLRKPGARTGCRLIHLQSVRDFLTAQMEGGGFVNAKRVNMVALAGILSATVGVLADSPSRKIFYD
jgi:hypothetical protein